MSIAVDHEKRLACCRRMGNAPNHFSYEVLSNGDVVISHLGRRARILRGTTARQFIIDVERHAPEALMARLTGNYKRGNERTAKHHPRNRKG